MPVHQDDRVLVDYRTSDDAGVYRWDETRALVQTVDFFTPIVDDAYTFGQIAAVNALSDVYAMGGRPLTALAIAAFPRQAVDDGIVREVFRGGLDKLREAAVALLGGHTVQDREIKFGYAVTGVVDPRRVLTNAGARPGDVVLLTKPIGTGVIATAIKYARAPQDAVDEAIGVMLTLNRAAADVLQAQPPGVVHACTDVTGFGLIGHVEEMASASGVSIRITAGAVPLITGALKLARQNRSGGLGTNEAHFHATVNASPSMDPDLLTLFYDPQTSGGLLATVDPAHGAEVAAALASARVRCERIGVVVARGAAAVVVV
jgi:selenide, water dikinase